MSDPVLVAVVGAVGAILAGVLVELIRARRSVSRVEESGRRVEAEVTPNGGSSLRDAIGRIETEVIRIRDGQTRHGERLAAVEARLDERTRRTP
jgi:hypothetical protein